MNRLNHFEYYTSWRADYQLRPWRLSREDRHTPAKLQGGGVSFPRRVKATSAEDTSSQSMPEVGQVFPQIVGDGGDVAGGAAVAEGFGGHAAGGDAVAGGDGGY